MPAVLVSALLGLLAGPYLHHFAVQAGHDDSFALSAARCRRCRASHRRLFAACPECGLSPTRVWVTAGATALVAAAVAWRLGPVWALGGYLLFVALTVALFLTDIDHKRIPNRITYPGTPAAAALLTVGALADGNTEALPGALLGAVVYSGFFFAVFLAARGGFGFGDVKLAVLLGLFLGYLGWARLLVGGFLTAGIGGLMALGAIALGRAGAKTEIPYGPAMILGAWATVIGGQPLIDLFL